MTTLRTPEAPATSRQLWLLHILTKQDTRDWDLTMQQASDKIAELKSNGSHQPANPQTATTQQTQVENKWHYCVMYGYPPSNHHWSNHLWRWKACLTTKDKRQALQKYNECLRLENEPWHAGHEYALVYCVGAHFAKRMLQAGVRTEGKLAKILQTTIKAETGTNPPMGVKTTHHNQNLGA